MPLRKRSLMRPYQKWFARLCIQKRKVGLWLDMGAGKTLIALTAAGYLLDNFEIWRVLIVAPKRVAEETWPDEISEWEHTHHLSYELLTGNAKKRAEAADRWADVHIINRENLPWLYQHFNNGRDWPYDCVIIDEASSFKSHEKRTERGNITRFGVMTMVAKYTRYMFQLTGTPASNGYIQLWPQIYLLDGGDRLGKNISAYRSRWFQKEEYGFGYNIMPWAIEQIDNTLSDICFSLPEKFYPELPPVTYNIVSIKLPQAVKKKYDQFKKDYILELTDIFGDEYELEAQTAAVLSNKLLQLASGCVYDEEKEPNHIHDLKLDALDELIEGANGAPVLIAYNFKSDLDRIRKKYPKAVVLNEDKMAVKNWNAGKVQMLLAHPASAGHGLNLQHGGNTIIWFGPNWSLELWQQMNKRLHRPGQTKPVFIHILSAAGTIDEKVMRVLGQKDATQKSLMQAVLAEI